MSKYLVVGCLDPQGAAMVQLFPHHQLESMEPETNGWCRHYWCRCFASINPRALRWNLVPTCLKVCLRGGVLPLTVHELSFVVTCG